MLNDNEFDEYLRQGIKEAIDSIPVSEEEKTSDMVQLYDIQCSFGFIVFCGVGCDRSIPCIDRHST